MYASRLLAGDRTGWDFHVVSDQTFYQMLDVLLVAFHTLLVGFNTLGWVWKRTRRLHLFTISATLLSWFGLGVIHGWGYCPLTDWHWQVKRELGETHLPASCMKFYLDRITGADWSPAVVDALVIGAALGALVVSVVLNVRDIRRARPAGRIRGCPAGGRGGERAE